MPRLAEIDARVVAVASVVVVALMARLPTLAQPLVEAHAFRQTQTAFTALWYHRYGTNLLESPVPVLGPPWVIPFELPAFQGIAAAVMDFGVMPEVALRGTSLVFFAISLILLHRITSLELDRRTAEIASLAFVLAPLGLLWSRTSTIETMAVAASLGSVLGLLHWDRSRSRWGLAFALVLGGAAAMIKLTTAFVWLLPSLLFLSMSRRASLLVGGTAAASGLAWTAYADAIKAASPATSFLTSWELRSWNLGTIADRLDPAAWADMGGFAAGLGLSVVFAPLVARRSRLGAWAFTTMAIGPLAFVYLYAAHDYYWMAVAPAAAILIGIVVRHALATPFTSVRRSRCAALVAVFAVSFVAYPRWLLMLYPADDEEVLPLAAQIRAETTPDTLVAISGRDWSPALLYYADRLGYMENPDSPPAPAGYTRYECPGLGLPGACLRLTSEGP